MKKISAMLALLFSCASFAYTASDARLSQIANYHAQNQAYIAKYKVLNGGAMNHFLAVIELDCNNDEFADWRIKQYDENYKACERAKYEMAYERAGLDISQVKANRHLGEALKIELAKRQGFKISKEYSIEQIDIRDENISVRNLVDLANELTKLVSED